MEGKNESCESYLGGEMDQRKRDLRLYTKMFKDHERAT